jgi:hypothetical protein
MQMTVTLDEAARPLKAEIPVGGATVTEERVFVRGSP